jgi:acetate kinase
VLVLVLNAGSSSLKGSLVAPHDRRVAAAEIGWGADATRAGDRAGSVGELVARLRDAAAAAGETGIPDAVGHRVVHGGSRFTAPARIDREVLAGIRSVRELAPLHNGVALDAIDAAMDALPAEPHVACFDTAFHARLPEEVVRYPLPRAWSSAWGVRRYGFHGLSVAWSAERAARLLGRPAQDLAIVVAHLGSGCSVTAVAGGRSVSTSMGFTPLEGLMMGTRAGSIDPGILLRLLADGRLTVDELAEVLDHGAGLLAVAGTADMREVLARADTGDPDAALALAMFANRAAAGIAAASTALPRLDALVFTGGIGERAAPVRAAIAGRLGTLGVAPLHDRVAEREDDAVLSAPADRVAVLRVEAREDLVIAREVRAVLGR